MTKCLKRDAHVVSLYQIKYLNTIQNKDASRGLTFFQPDKQGRLPFQSRVELASLGEAFNVVLVLSCLQGSSARDLLDPSSSHRSQATTTQQHRSSHLSDSLYLCPIFCPQQRHQSRAALNIINLVTHRNTDYSALQSSLPPRWPLIESTWAGAAIILSPNHIIT